MKLPVLIVLLFSAQLIVAQMFSSAKIIDPTSVTNHVILVEDMDNDSDMDVVTAGTGLVAWYENTDGLGTFSGPHPIQEGLLQTFGMVIDDFDDDNRKDVVVSFFDADEVYWYKNLGGGNFASGVLLASGLDRASEVFAGDISGDNDPDIVLGVSNGQGFYWMENLPASGDFSTPMTIDAALPQARRQSLGDIDGDTDLDLVTNASSGTFIYWYENTDGQGDFSIQHTIPTAGLYENFHFLVDINGDHDLDIFSITVDEFIWRENLDGQGTFSSVQVIDNAGALTFGDFRPVDLDLDDDLDAVMVSFDTKVNWYENLDGAGTFGSATLIDDTIASPNRVAVGDLDGDTDIDIIVSSVITNGEKILVWYENRTILGTDNFSGHTISISPNPVSDVLRIESDYPIQKVEIFDVQGRLLKKILQGFQEIKVNIPSGLFFLSVHTDAGVYTERLVKD